MKNGKKRSHWYEGIVEAFQMYIPGNRMYRTIQARRARTGTLFILPLIIGFLVFMVRPLFISLQMSLSKVIVAEGTMSPFNITLNLFGRDLVLPLGNYNYAFLSDPDFNKLLVDEIGRMAINTIATLVMSFVIAVILNQEFKRTTVCRIIFFLPGTGKDSKSHGTGNRLPTLFPCRRKRHLEKNEKHSPERIRAAVRAL